jgi:hypothetical protein
MALVAISSSGRGGSWPHVGARHVVIRIGRIAPGLQTNGLAEGGLDHSAADLDLGGMRLPMSLPGPER